MVEEGLFRQDLYYRLNVIELTSPPLRTRATDIPELVEHLLTKLSSINGQPLPSLSKTAINALKQYSFPGNVRELENILERAMALYDGSVIELEDLNLPKLGKAQSDIQKSEKFNPSEISLEDYLEEIEKETLSRALEENKWNKTATAKHLGLTFRSLRYRLKKLELE
jgi:two-component system response regulator PilR (NtrC family)